MSVTDYRVKMARKSNMLPGLVGAFGAALLCMASCARMGTPSGGPRDEDPPRFVSANPPQGALDVTQTSMTLTFDELVNVKDAFQKVAVSPAGTMPRVTSAGRRVHIEFDSLAPATTYTVDFADAIEDNNEGNKLQGFTYTFSTGPTLDSLRVAGRVLSARALEPQQGMLVGVHADLSDSAFTSRPLLRVARTDDRGRFTIRGLAPGTYRVFALGDNDNDYRYSSPEEDMAFLDVTVSPTSRAAVAFDTVYNTLTGAVDTVVERARTQFMPNDVVLRSFNSGLRQQYLSKHERLDSTRVFLKFNARAESLPDIEVLGRPGMRSPGVPEASEGLDSLVWWLRPELMREDTLRLRVAYTRSDQNLVRTAAADTLEFITRRVKTKPSKQKRRVSAADSIAAITTRFEVKSGTQQEVNLPLLLESATPLERFDTAAVHLSVLVDTLYRPVAGAPRVTVPDTLQPRRFAVEYPWEYGAKYRLEIDSLAATDIHGLPTLPLSHDLTVKQTGDYCSLLFHLTGLGGTPAFVELLDGSDAVKRTAPVEQGDAFFPFLAPGRYYARVVVDANGNGEYDTGNYLTGQQPEVVYYYPKAVSIKKNWDKEEQWAVFDTPVDMMKPMAVTKNKPASSRSRNRNAENADEDEDEDEIFDPTRNPFDPNDKSKSKKY